MLYVGRLSPEKEIDVLIKTYFILRQVRQQDIHLIIIGDGARSNSTATAESGWQHCFTGSLTGEKLSAVYASADVLFCFASQVETFGNVVLEAMASGLPVIAYDDACCIYSMVKMGWLSRLGHRQDFIQQMLGLPDL